MYRKGIILAGGLGSRLRPITNSISKQLLPVYNKPMIYYSLTTLMLSGIRKILLISTRQQIKIFKHLLSDGSKWGLTLDYIVQDNPNGIAESLILGENFIKKSKIALILGDNLFYSNDLSRILTKLSKSNKNSILCNEVSNPSNYGIISLDKNKNITSIVEKPLKPKSNYAITGLYYLNNEAIEIAKDIKPSKRGELEITSVLNNLLKKKKLKYYLFGRGLNWFDMGDFDDLLDAGNFIRSIEKRHQQIIACPEEIAFKNKWINKKKLVSIINKLGNNNYKNYLSNLLKK
jgi:glucose-1-phosphate thymidylyltransferase|tara:strand:+ start:1692 stop:2561 length:870 start_codon:yes stop_codon:yes gene_type:complete